MVDEEKAKKIAMEHISTHIHIAGDEIVIMDDKTIEKKWGWIFFYQGKRWIDTNDRRYKILGLYPLVIEKNDGSLHYLNVGTSIEECIREYEETRKVIS
jgi:Immunity protein 35